jgi:hypothetical protein
MRTRSLADTIGAENARAYYHMVAKVESNHNPKAKNPRSTASGLYQPIKSTWEGLGFKWADRWDVATQNLFIEKFTFSNVRELLASGCAINFATLYGAHFLGANGLLKTMRGKPNDPITSVTSAAQRKANPAILGELIDNSYAVKESFRRRTVKDFCDWLETKTGHSVYTNLVQGKISAPAPEVPATKEGNAVMNWTNLLVNKTVLQYILNAIGGALLARGFMDAELWAQISGALLVAVPSIFGAKSAATEKVMLGGSVSKVADLSPATQNAIAKEIGAK